MKAITNFKYQWIFEEDKNRLFVKYSGDNNWSEITEKKPAPYGGIFWHIEPANKSHWLQTILRPERIDVFYKLSSGEQTIYYKKHLSKQEVSEWQFDFLDIVEPIFDEIKGKNKWVFKHKSKADFIKG